MRIYVDLDLRQMVIAPGIRQAVSSLTFKRGDAETLEVQYVQGGEVVDPGTPDVFFCVKPLGDFDGDPLVLHTEFTKTGEDASAIWTGSPNFNTVELNEALGVGETADVSSLAASCEVGFTLAGAQTTSRTVRCVIENDLYRGGEGLPTPATAPYPDNPPANTVLTGSEAGGTWLLRTFAQVWEKFKSDTGLFWSWNRLEDVPAEFPPEAHEHDAADITSGTFADARIPSLDAAKITTGIIAKERLPSLSLTETVLVANQTARLALTNAQAEGKIVKQLDTGVTYGLPTGSDPTVNGNWVKLGDADIDLADVIGLTAALAAKQDANANLTAEAGLTGAADRVSYYTGLGAKALAIFTSFGRSLVAAADAATFKALLSLVKADVGLGSVDDTADGDKPVSTAQAEADLQVALSRQQGPYFYSDGVTTGRRIQHVMGDHGDIAGAPAITLLVEMDVPASLSASIYPGYVSTALLNPSLTGRSANCLAMVMHQSVGVWIGQYGDNPGGGVNTPDYRHMVMATPQFLATYGGKSIRLAAIITAGGGNPQIIINGVDTTASWTADSAGTVPDWLDAATMGTTYHLSGHNAPAGPAPVSRIINAALTPSEALEWTAGGRLPAWAEFGGSQVSFVSGDSSTFDSGIGSWATYGSSTIVNDGLGAADVHLEDRISLVVGELGRMPGRYLITFDIPTWSAGTSIGSRVARSDSAGTVAGSVTITGAGSYSYIADVAMRRGGPDALQDRVWFIGLADFKLDNVRVRRLGLLSDPRPNPPEVYAARDTTLTGQSALLIGMTGMGTPSPDWDMGHIVTGAPGNYLLLGGTTLAIAGVAIRRISVRPKAAMTVYLGTTSGGSQIVSSVALTANVWQDLTVILPRNTAGNIYVNKSTADDLYWRVSGNVEKPAAY